MGVTINVRRRIWGTNQPVEGYDDFVAIIDNSLPGAPYLFNPGPTSSEEDDKTYAFVFWTYYQNNQTSVIVTQEPSPLVDDVKPDSDATAWYMEIGGPGGQPGVSVQAFSMSQNMFVPDNPIAGVYKLDENNNPTTTPADWPGWPNGISTVEQGIKIVLKNSLLSGVFKEWVVIGNNWSINGKTMIVPKGGWAIAAAFYGPSSIDRRPPFDIDEHMYPDWWWWLRKYLDKFKPQVDPSPEMITIIHDKLSQWDAIGRGAIMEGVDMVGRLISQIPKMDKTQRQAALLKVKADIDRLKLADKMLSGAFKETATVRKTAKKATTTKAPAKKEASKKQATKKEAVKKETAKKAKAGSKKPVKAKVPAKATKRNAGKKK